MFSVDMDDLNCLQSEPWLLTFLSHLSKATNEDLDAALAPCVSFECELRKYFASLCVNIPRPEPRYRYAGLLDVFSIPDRPQVLKARPRIVHSDEELGVRDQKFIFALPEEKRSLAGAPVTIESFSAFLRCWEIFSEGSLTEMNWNNVIAAGGSVLSCISVVDPGVRTSTHTLRRHFRREEYVSSDIDLFIWGLSRSEV